MSNRPDNEFKIPEDDLDPNRPVVKFRYRPRRQNVASNKIALLIGGAALVVITILLLRLF